MQTKLEHPVPWHTIGILQILLAYNSEDPAWVLCKCIQMKIVHATDRQAETEPLRFCKRMQEKICLVLLIGDLSRIFILNAVTDVDQDMM